MAHHHVVDDIHAFIMTVCPTAPSKKDRIRRYLGYKQWETAPRIFKFETWDELWAQFKTAKPASWAKRVQEKHPDRFPQTFINNTPWNLVEGKCVSCLCQTCENCERHTRARHECGTALTGLLKTDEAEDELEVGDEVEVDYFNRGEWCSATIVKCRDDGAYDVCVAGQRRGQGRGRGRGRGRGGRRGRGRGRRDVGTATRRVERAAVRVPGQPHLDHQKLR